MIDYTDFSSISKDEKQCLCEESADKGSVDAIYSYCRTLPNSDECIKYLSKEANNQNNEEMNEYAVALLNRDMISINRKEAFKYFKLDTVNDFVIAMNN